MLKEYSSSSIDILTLCSAAGEKTQDFCGRDTYNHHILKGRIGIVVKGRVDFVKGDGGLLELGAGDSYYFAPMDPHGLRAHEKTELIECFAPSRDDYKV